MEKLVKIGEAAKHYGVSQVTLREWCRQGKVECETTPGGTRLFKIPHNRGRKQVFYCRVSSQHQKDDLERQIAKAKAMYPETEIIRDIGSGINWHRKGLLSILERAKSGELEKVIVFHRDRLSRISFELIEEFLRLFGTIIEVVDSGEESREEELANDLMSIVQVFCCRAMGKRRYKEQEVQTSTRQGDKE